MQCLRPWLDGLEDPATMKANLLDLDNTLNGQVKVELALLKTNTDSLVVGGYSHPNTQALHAERSREYTH